MMRRKAAGLVAGGLLGMTGLAAALTDAWARRTLGGALSWTATRIGTRRALAWAGAGATRAWARRSLASPLPSSAPSSPSPLPLAWIGAGPEGRAVAVTLGSRAFLRVAPDDDGRARSMTGTFAPGPEDDTPGEILMRRLRAREAAAAAHFSRFIYPPWGAESSYRTGVSTAY